MGSADRIIRLILAVLFTALYFMDIVSGTLGLILMIAAGIFLLTSLKYDLVALLALHLMNSIP